MVAVHFFLSETVSLELRRKRCNLAVKIGYDTEKMANIQWLDGGLAPSEAAPGSRNRRQIVALSPRPRRENRRK